MANPFDFTIHQILMKAVQKHAWPKASDGDSQNASLGLNTAGLVGWQNQNPYGKQAFR